MTDPTDPAIVAELAATGTLRVAINLGNPVLTHGTAEEPGGVTVDIAREVGRRLGVPVELTSVDAARRSLELMASGQADLCFLAVDPTRAEEVAFSIPYLIIEGVYVVPAGSALHTVEDVDAPGVRVGVKEGSAYDLHLSRELQHAQAVRGAEGTDVFLEQGLEAGAGIRQPLTTLVEQRPDLRLVADAFMQIRQAVGIPRDRSEGVVGWLERTVTDLVVSGFVAESLERAGQDPALAAYPG